MPLTAFDADRAALCIVEMQNDMVHESNIDTQGLRGVLAMQVKKRGVLPKLQALIAACRARQVPLLFINYALKPGFPRPNTLLHRRSQKQPTLIEGTWGAETHADVAPQPEDFVLLRTVGVDGSYGTQLYPVLRMLRRTTMLMTGISTNIAIESIVRASVNRGFDMMVVEDCCASYPDEWHEWTIRNIMPLLATVTSSTEVAQALETGT
jgi:nicotinamidase-related amidase